MSSKKSHKRSYRHTRAIQRDRTKRPATPAPAAEVEARITDIVHPATWNQVAHFHALGLRERTLTLPVMMAFVLSLIWRQLGSVAETVRVLQREGVLWSSAQRVSQQAVEQRFSSLPAVLFERVFVEVVPHLTARWQQRRRPLPPALQWAHDHFTATVAVDGSTLDALVRKTGLLRDGPQGVLAGRMAGILDVVSRLPRQVWYEEDAQAHDQRFWDRILGGLERGMLVIFDLGFLNFARFDQLTDAGVWFLTRKDDRVVVTTEQVLEQHATLHDQIVRMGSASARPCRHMVRLVAWQHQGKWYRYVTNVLDPAQLPAAYVVALYGQRWRIEDTFHVIKRLLGLAYFWVGSTNGVQLQVWATWILYAVLVDLTDDVAETLRKPFHALSMEMVYRGLYHYTVAVHRGTAADPVAYLAADAKGLGILKRERTHRTAITDLLYLTIPPPP